LMSGDGGGCAVCRVRLLSEAGRGQEGSYEEQGDG
jgi:hypothetical protein